MTVPDHEAVGEPFWLTSLVQKEPVVIGFIAAAAGDAASRLVIAHHWLGASQASGLDQAVTGTVSTVAFLAAGFLVRHFTKPVKATQP